MTKVIDFPTQSVRDWAEFERIARDTLDGLQVPRDSHDQFLARIKPLYDKCFNRDLTIQFPWSDLPPLPTELNSRIQAAVNTGIQQFSSELSALINELFFDLVRREIELCLRDHGIQQP